MKKYPEDFLNTINAARLLQIEADIKMIQKHRPDISPEAAKALAERGNPEYTEAELEAFYKEMTPIIFER
jgi:hypothetical protein